VEPLTRRCASCGGRAELAGTVAEPETSITVGLVPVGSVGSQSHSLHYTCSCGAVFRLLPGATRGRLGAGVVVGCALVGLAASVGGAEGRGPLLGLVGVATAVSSAVVLAIDTKKRVANPPST